MQKRSGSWRRQDAYFHIGLMIPVRNQARDAIVVALQSPTQKEQANRSNSREGPVRARYPRPLQASIMKDSPLFASSGAWNIFRVTAAQPPCPPAPFVAPRPYSSRVNSHAHQYSSGCLSGGQATHRVLIRGSTAVAKWLYSSIPVVLQG